jgi:hypothetical protein
MRWLALGALMCLVSVAPIAHASTGRQGPSQKRDSVAPARKGGPAISAEQQRVNLGSRRQSSKLILDEPLSPRSPTSPTIESIKSLANGDSLLNPWVPGRGAVGVNVKVTW